LKPNAQKTAQKIKKRIYSAYKIWQKYKIHRNLGKEKTIWVSQTNSGSFYLFSSLYPLKTFIKYHHNATMFRNLGLYFDKNPKIIHDPGPGSQ
jgi:hypothetical protein